MAGYRAPESVVSRRCAGSVTAAGRPCCSGSGAVVFYCPPLEGSGWRRACCDTVLPWPSAGPRPWSAWLPFPSFQCGRLGSRAPPRIPVALSGSGGGSPGAEGLFGRPFSPTPLPCPRCITPTNRYALPSSSCSTPYIPSLLSSGLSWWACRGLAFPLSFPPLGGMGRESAGPCPAAT